MDELKPNMTALIGSSDLLGNPNHFKKSMGSGFAALTTMPKEGFEQGLVEGSFGVVKGTAGLAKYTVAGSAGSLSRFTMAVNKPLAALSFDDGFIAQKELNDLKNKPTGIIDGVGKGASAFGNSFLSGVKGLYQKPQ